MSSWTEERVDRLKVKWGLVGRRSTKSQPASTRLPLFAPSPPVIERAALKLDNGEFVTTSTLTSRSCKWPIGDPTELDFHYCGQLSEPGGSYCDVHKRKGHQSRASMRAIHWKSPLARSR